jgi:hypothetical protein
MHLPKNIDYKPPHYVSFSILFVTSTLLHPLQHLVLRHPQSKRHRRYGAEIHCRRCILSANPYVSTC